MKVSIVFPTYNQAEHLEKSIESILNQDFQDFELPLSDEPMLVAKICQYVGLEIREADVLAFGQNLEITENQQQS